MSPSTIKDYPETDSGQPMPPKPNRVVVCVNISESRTRNFIRELGRRGILAVEFRTATLKNVVFELMSFIRATREADFVLCGGPLRSQILWMLVAKLLRVPCVVDSPMDYTEWPFANAWHCKWGVRVALKLADYVLTLKSRDYFITKFGLKKERVLFLENCADRRRVESSFEEGTAQFRRRPNSFLICCSGCHQTHRLERFMPIFDELIAMAPNAELLFIGDPKQPTIIESKRYAEGRGYAERVHAIPVIPSAEDFYATVAQCDLWVATLADDTLQGRHELRMELLEVGLLAKPVVAAPTPGLAESGLGSGGGLIFIDPIDPQGSARTIAEFIRQPQLLEESGAKLRACVTERFSLSDAVDELLRTVRGHRGARNGTEPVSHATAKGKQS